METTVLMDSIETVLGMFADRTPGQVVMFQAIKAGYRKSGLGDRYFPFIMNLLIYNQYLSNEKFPMVTLTERGYALLHDDMQADLHVDLY